MSHPEEDPAPDTLRTCLACLGQGGECSWCAGGFQTTEQFRKWSEVRLRMKKSSGTYSFLEDVTLDVLERLRSEGSDEALALVLEGHKLLETWTFADPTGGDRSAAAGALTDFTKSALDLLQKP